MLAYLKDLMRMVQRDASAATKMLPLPCHSLAQLTAPSGCLDFEIAIDEKFSYLR
jgi:hypothetical protein